LANDSAEGQIGEPPSRIKSDERVVFFPTAARLSVDGKSWIVPIHGWVFEPEEGDLLRGMAMGQVRRKLGLDPNQPATVAFEDRVRWFLVDNERGKRISIRIGGQEYTLPPSNRDGHFQGVVSVSRDDVDELADHGRLRFSAVTQSDDNRDFRGVVHLIGPKGTSVISDIDDTIKVSEVTDKKRLVTNTFFRPFRAVDEMADVYSGWARTGVQFHFVSSSPWQLYVPLSNFASEAGFPQATYHLKRLRLKDSSFWQLFADPLKTKSATIEPILAAYAGRKFVLVGDSGEKDPEVYGTLARRHPDQVLRIYIRDVTGEPADSVRYSKAFEDLSAGKWRVFRDPSKLELPEDSNGG